MLIDLKWLKLHPRATEEFYVEGPGRDDLLADIGGRFVEPIRVALTVENTGRTYIGRGKVTTCLQLLCSRCLSEFTYPVNADLFLTIAESSVKDEKDRDEDLILIKGTKVNLREYVEEIIISEIPLAPLCKNECEGLCPECGQNRNTSNCNCSQMVLDPRWDKLKEIKQKEVSRGGST
ncbi:MAG: YceD family protein [Syntrophomonadaceae bacterium]